MNLDSKPLQGRPNAQAEACGYQILQEDNLCMKQFLSVVVLSLVLAVPLISQAAGAASMSLDAVSYSAERGEQFDVTVRVNPNGESLDTVRAVVTFDPTLLQVTNISLVGEMDRVAPGNYYDNTTGKVSWGAFTLEGPVTSEGSFMIMTFLALQEGSAEMEISADSRAISNGEERIDTGNLGSSEVTVSASSTAEVGTALIVVESESHPNDVDWYANNSINFSWTTLAGESDLTAYYYSFDERSDTDPTTYLGARESELSFEGVSDGVHYLHLKGVHVGGKETITTHRRVNVDITAPHAIELLAQDNKILEGESAWFTFATIDDVSGVLQYQIAINDSGYQVQESPLEMTDLEAGTYFFRVAAIDRAGNASYGSTSVRVYPEGTDLSRPQGYEETAELTAIVNAEPQPEKNTKLLITLILGAIAVVGIILGKKKKKNKS